MAVVDPRICPCCGQQWPPGRTKNDAVKVLRELMWPGPVQDKVITRLLRSFGEWVTRRDLIDAAYCEDPDGGPDSANSTMAVTINRIRKRVRLVGLELDGRSWAGSRLRWAAPAATASGRAATQSEPVPRAKRASAFPSPSVPTKITG